MSELPLRYDGQSVSVTPSGQMCFFSQLSEEEHTLLKKLNPIRLLIRGRNAATCHSSLKWYSTPTPPEAVFAAFTPVQYHPCKRFKLCATDYNVRLYATHNLSILYVGHQKTWVLISLLLGLFRLNDVCICQTIDRSELNKYSQGGIWCSLTCKYKYCTHRVGFLGIPVGR